MRAVTVRQPWAWALFHGKSPENRSGVQFKNLRGTVAIHAGQHLEGPAAFETIDRLSPDTLPYLGQPREAVEAQLGGLVGVVDVTDVHWWADCRRHGGALCSPWAERDRHHLVLERPRVLTELVPCPGRLGAWRIPTFEFEHLKRVLPR